MIINCQTKHHTGLINNQLLKHIYTTIYEKNQNTQHGGISKKLRQKQTDQLVSYLKIFKCITKLELIFFNHKNTCIRNSKLVNYNSTNYITISKRC